MPKEHLSAANLYEPSPDGDGFREHHCGVAVAWTKGSGTVHISPAWYQADYPDAPRTHPDAALLPEAQTSDEAAERNRTGWHDFEKLARSMNWQQLNTFIAVLRRARDDANGKPE